jgi:hydrogenase expression/formation protein HypD
MDNKALLRKMVKHIQEETRPISIMEVCGTHTMAIAKSGIRELLPPNIKLISGPGCPVCITAQGDIDTVIELASHKNIIMATFGDMIRVPGTHTSLQEARSQGAEVRVVYSPLDALELAKNNPDKEVVFLGIGFETTAPTVGASIEAAKTRQLHNYSVLSLHKLVPPALEHIFSVPDIKVDALLCPGHVSMIIGLEPYRLLVEKYHKPCVVAGFEAIDILESLIMILLQFEQNKPQALIQYQRAVKEEGNPVARNIINKVFQAADTRWRGLGIIPGSGLEIRDEYSQFDARKKFDLPDLEDVPIKGCSCGEILTGRITPHECHLFGKACTPINPIGPCMVSQEGACAAYYRYTPLRGR